MGTTNWGNQILSVKYASPANAEIINQRLKHIEPEGIYSGGWAAPSGLDNKVTVVPFTAVLKDPDTGSQVYVRTTESFLYTADLTRPYVVLEWNYVATTDNYVDVVSVSSPSEGQYVLFKFTGTPSAGDTSAPVSYSERDYTRAVDYNLKIQSMYSSFASFNNQVFFHGGLVRLADSVVEVSPQIITLDTVVSSGKSRIDVITVDLSGSLTVTKGVEATSPSAPSFSGIACAFVTRSYGVSYIDEDSIEDIRCLVNAAPSPWEYDVSSNYIYVSSSKIGIQTLSNVANLNVADSMSLINVSGNPTLKFVDNSGVTRVYFLLGSSWFVVRDSSGDTMSYWKFGTGVFYANKGLVLETRSSAPSYELGRIWVQTS